MFQLQSYLDRLVSECRTAFGDRLLYVGLQGSYLRGEAHADSDIDIMLVLDRMSVDDMETYRDILKRIGYYEKSCGFICGIDELKRWNPLEVCQLSHTTKDILGCLTDHLPNATRADEINYVKYSLGNLYHELCHRYIHADREKNRERFRNSCKGIFFLLQNLHYLESGTFAVTKEELRSLISEEDRIVLSITDLPEEYDFDRMFRLVFDWIRNTFVRIERIK